MAAPTGNSESRNASVEAKVRRRVALEKQAYEFVKHLSLTDSITEEELVNIGQQITREQYHDVTEERSIERICGYPVCPNPIVNILKQQYRISLKNKAVYDLTERKKFCSNHCYEASKLFQNQISETPVWVRVAEAPVKFTLLKKDDTQKVFHRGRNGEYVCGCPWIDTLEAVEGLKLNDKSDSSTFNATTEKTASEQRNESTAVSNGHKEPPSEKKNSAHVKSTTTVAPPSDKQNIAKVAFDATAVPAAASASKCQASVTDRSCSTSASACEQQKPSAATLKEAVTPRPPVHTLSLIEKLQLVREWRTSRTAEYFHCSPRKEDALSEFEIKALKFYNNTTEESKDDSRVRIVPVDHCSQHTQRRRIVIERLDHVWPKLSELFNVNIREFISDIRDLICTFDFTSKNIVFNPMEWLLVGYILLTMLDKKKGLFEQRMAQMNLDGFPVSQKELLEIVDYMISCGDKEKEAVEHRIHCDENDMEMVD